MLYKAGESKLAIARHFGISDMTVAAHLERRQVESRVRRRLHEDQLAEVVERYAAGESIRSLAHALKVSREAVRSALDAAGCPIRGPG